MDSTRDDFMRWQEEQKRAAEQSKKSEANKLESVQEVKQSVPAPAEPKPIEAKEKTIKVNQKSIEPVEHRKSISIEKEKINKEPVERDSYVVREMKYGIGLGVTGLGKMVHLEEKFNTSGEVERFYRLRKEKDTPRMVDKAVTTVEEAIYKEDIYQTSTPRIATALIEEVMEIYSKRINSTLKNPILMKDIFNYLLLKELEDEKARKILTKVLINGNQQSNLAKMIKWDKENKEVKTNVVESNNSQDLLIQSIDRQNNSISDMARQNKVLQEQNQQLAEQLYGLTRTLAYQEGIRTGLVNASHLRSTSDFLGALATDETTRVVNAIQETGSNELKRQETIRNSKARNGFK